jgi:hypothetical protein
VPGAALNGVMMVPQTAMGTPTMPPPGAMPLSNVAGASGAGMGGAALGGGSGDLASVLTQVTAALQQLVSALGSSGVGGVNGGGPGGKPGQGPEQAGCTMPCANGGTPPTPPKTPPGKAGKAKKHGKHDVGGEHGDHKKGKAGKQDKGHKQHKADHKPAHKPEHKPNQTPPPPPPGKPDQTPPPPGKPDGPPPPPPAGPNGGPPPVDQTPPLPTAAAIQGQGHSTWDKAHSNVKVSLLGRDFSFDPTNLHDPTVANGRATWNYNARTETFEVDGQQVKVTFKPSFSIKESELAPGGYVKAGVNPTIGLQVLKVEKA